MYIPIISGYKPFYIQTESDTLALNTVSEWGLVAKTNPYPLLPSVRAPYSNDWKDENGKDEYDSFMAYEPLEFEVSFYVKAYSENKHDASLVLRNQMESFFKKIMKGTFKVYDSYAGLGFKDVRYNGYKENEIKSGKDWFRSIFTIKFKANDPLTRMILSNGKIVVDQSLRPYVIDTTLHFPVDAVANGNELICKGTVSGTTLNL